MDRIEPSLKAALDKASDGEVLEVMVTMAGTEKEKSLESVGEGPVSPPDVEEVLKKVAEASQSQPEQVDVYQNLGTAMVRAQSGFVRELAERTEATQISLRNPTEQPSLIQPIEKGEIDLENRE